MRRAKLQPATTALIPQLYALEKLSFPEDEAADEAGVFFRCQNANSYFQVLRKEYALHDSFGGDSHDYDSGSEEGDIIGYVNATLDTGTVIKHESMSSHNVDGETLVIHSVTIAPHFRRKGWGSFMLKAYLQLLLPNTQVKRILLLAKAHLLSFYVDCGFKVVRLSPVSTLPCLVLSSYTCMVMMSILTSVSPLPALSIHIFLTFHLRLFLSPCPHRNYRCSMVRTSGST